MTAVPPTRPALRERYERRRQRVVDAAAVLFARQGYQATSMTDLTEATGLTAGGLYHYIGSKERLLIRICDELLDPLLEQARAIAGAEGPPEHTLRALVRTWLAHVEDHLAHMVVFQQERRILEQEPQWKRIRDARKDFERVVDSVLARVEAEGGGLALADRGLALRALLGMVNATPQWYRPGERLGTAEIADGYCDLVLRRVSPPAR